MVSHTSHVCFPFIYNTQHFYTFGWEVCCVLGSSVVRWVIPWIGPSVRRLDPEGIYRKKKTI